MDLTQVIGISLPTRFQAFRDLWVVKPSHRSTSKRAPKGLKEQEIVARI